MYINVDRGGIASDGCASDGCTSAESELNTNFQSPLGRGTVCARSAKLKTASTPL
jgi:hypothetical protein